MRGLNLPKKQVYLGPASLIRRLIAFVLDLLIIDVVVASPFKNKLSSALPRASSISELQNIVQGSQVLIAQISLIILAISVLSLLYFSFMQMILGQTVGMMVLNIYVVKQEKKQILKPGIWQCIIRNMFVIPFFPFFVLWLTEPLFLLFSRERRRLLEVISGTMTVEEMTG